MLQQGMEKKTGPSGKYPKAAFTSTELKMAFSERSADDEPVEYCMGQYKNITQQQHKGN